MASRLHCSRDEGSVVTTRDTRSSNCSTRKTIRFTASFMSNLRAWRTLGRARKVADVSRVRGSAGHHHGSENLQPQHGLDQVQLEQEATDPQSQEGGSQRACHTTGAHPTAFGRHEGVALIEQTALLWQLGSCLFGVASPGSGSSPSTLARKSLTAWVQLTIRVRECPTVSAHPS